ncbi:5-formyltetrahydrofolate cyclo-ligase [Flavobacterium sp. 9AF]|uniref:5-formyltetrahydrofolate cyclo-ligase n=1 Tax=Flavobacterium sp. 9AF TaxID=2653142 RepID=UPI0012F0DF65|nr:5-formyltetrahydrofolate cyclo-ligase [Flavobacterium sp. 9AF]VXB29320.1 5-formyltetrahydrofolate cyclo-ligase [Flavobacterium sp. 9AF]
MKKKDLRIKYKKLRQQLTKEEIEDKSLAIANQLLKLDIWNYTYYHLFLPIVELQEVNTEYILQILAGKDKEVVISKSNFDTITMTHYLLTENTKIKKNNYNIPEPVDGIEVPSKKIEIIFVPLLAYDTEKNRVGYGKGFYDSFFMECNKETVKIGLSFYDPEYKIEDIGINDVKLDHIITPTSIY